MTDTSHKTEIGNYFVSNYPPFSQWKPENTAEVDEILNRPPRTAQPLGLYLHIPFCRKRCKFCYFKVYTDKNASRDRGLSQRVDQRESSSTAGSRALQGRQLRVRLFRRRHAFLSQRTATRRPVERLNRHCQLGSSRRSHLRVRAGDAATESKLETLKEIGVTRLSLGIEHFDDEILAANGRAHLSPEIYRAYGWAREVDFPQINIDLIAGMMGETEEQLARDRAASDRTRTRFGHDLSDGTAV